VFLAFRQLPPQGVLEVRQDHVHLVALHLFGVFCQVLGDYQLQLALLLLPILFVGVDDPVRVDPVLQLFQYLHYNRLHHFGQISRQVFLDQFVPDSAVVDQTDRLVESHIGPDEVLVSVVQHYAGVFLDILGRHLLYPLWSRQLLERHVSLDILLWTQPRRQVLFIEVF
jgi:hypothetical protein